MDFSVKVEGLERLNQMTDRVKANIAAELKKATYASAQKIATEAKKSIASGPKTGRIYKRRTVSHRASAPGEAPASDTGKLIGSINAYSTGNTEAITVAGRGTAKYAKLLEFGTKNIAPRPFFFPALEKSKAWIAERLSKAVRDGARK